MASFSVVSNISSANAQSNLQATNMGLNKALTRLSSGFRINSSGDDAAGLALANTYRNDIAVISQGIRNANDGLSQLQIKDGALNNISTLLDRLATLAAQGSNTEDDATLTTLGNEYNEIRNEIEREATVAGLGTGDAGLSFSVFVSNEASAGDGVISGTLQAADLTALTLETSNVTWADSSAAKASLDLVTAAIGELGESQAKVGQMQNRLQFTISLAQSQVVNNKAAESRIRDANIAEESANMTRFNILSQSGIAALAQANQSSSSVLALLR
jgi:flagellin